MKILKRILAAALCLAMMLCIYISVSGIVANKESEGRMSAFFSEKENIDVMFFGSSHIRHSIFPMELWRDYGIVSYNLAGNEDTLPVAYWKMIMALDYKTPKLIVMDVYTLWSGLKTSIYGTGMLHSSIDAFPLSLDKIKAVNDLYDDRDTRFEMLFPFSSYHSRWSDLTQSDIKVNYDSSVCKGSLPINGYAPHVPEVDETPDDKVEYDAMSLSYLEKIIALCKEKNIQLLLVNSGYDADKATRLFADSVTDVAKQNDVNYIDFTKQNIIDFDTDLQSAGFNTHLNSSGSRKLTSYLGNVISTQYGIANERENAAYASWNDNYASYMQLKTRLMNECTAFTAMLTTLSDSDYNVIIQLKQNAELENADVVQALVQNASQYKELQEVENAFESQSEYLAVIDNAQKTAWENVGGSESIINTSLGMVSVGAQSICVNNGENLLAYEGVAPDAQIIVYDKYTGELVLHARFGTNARIS